MTRYSPLNKYNRCNFLAPITRKIRARSNLSPRTSPHTPIHRTPKTRNYKYSNPVLFLLPAKVPIITLLNYILYHPITVHTLLSRSRALFPRTITDIPPDIFALPIPRAFREPHARVSSHARGVNCLIPRATKFRAREMTTRTTSAKRSGYVRKSIEAGDGERG